MSKILTTLILTTFLLISCSSDDGGLKSSDKDAYAEYVSHSLVRRDSKDYSQFVYNVKSVTAIQLKGYLELTTKESKKYKSENFSISPGGLTRVTVLVEGSIHDVGFIEERKLYLRPILNVVDPLLPMN